MDARLRTALIVLGLFIAAWIPRVVGLDAFVSPDERKWLARSANFSYAIAHGDLSETFQREHPGVTVMWGGAAGLLQEFPQYTSLAPGYFAWDREHLEAWLAETGGPDPLALLNAGRWWIALIVSLALALAYLPLRRLLGEGPALLATLWIAWDPFAVALSRQLHPDGLVSILSFLAIVTFIAWLYGGRRWGTLIASGVVMGLAWLTKTPAIFVAVSGTLLVLVELFRCWRRDETGAAWPLVGTLVVWGALATLVFVVLWPAMWVDPVGTLSRMAVEMSVYVERHTNLNFFMGSPTEDPGPIFYPVAWLWRTTPAVVIGLAAAGWWGAKRRELLANETVRSTMGALLLFAAVFVIGMSIGAKKFDRYILPAFLALDVIAAVGWFATAQVAANRWGHQWVLPATAAAGLLALHAVFAPMHFPYYLTYFNPMVGSSLTAPGVLWVGWGEGLDEAARWLNDQEDAVDSRTAAFYNDGPFSYYYDGTASNLGYGSPLFWLGMDYAVTYINQRQRQVPSAETLAWFDAQQPVHEVRFRGLDLAQVYDLRGKPLPGFLDIAKENAADFGGLIRLLAYEFEKVQATPGDSFQASLYLQALEQMSSNYNVLLRLVGPDGSEIWRHEGWPWGAPTTEWPVREVRPDGHTVTVPADTAPGMYRYLVSFYDPQTLDLLPVNAVAERATTGSSEQAIALLQVGEPDPVIDSTTRLGDFGEVLALERSALVDEPAQLGEARLRVTWKSLGRDATPYTVFAHVLGPDGNQVAQSDSPPQSGFVATNLLLPGQRFDDEIRIPLPADLPSGEYTVQLGLYNGDKRLPATIDGQPAGDSLRAATFKIP